MGTSVLYTINDKLQCWAGLNSPVATAAHSLRPRRRLFSWSRQESKSKKDDTQAEAEESSNRHTQQVKGYALVFDNVNQKVTARHYTREKGNKMFNLVHAYAVKDRIQPGAELTTAIPPAEAIQRIPVEHYLPGQDDVTALKSEMGVMVQRLLVEHLACFEDLQPAVWWHIPNMYNTESTLKRTVVPLGVLDKDEACVRDMIDIMEHYQQYVPVKPDGRPVPTVLLRKGP